MSRIFEKNQNNEHLFFIKKELNDQKIRGILDTSFQSIASSQSGVGHSINYLTS